MFFSDLFLLRRCMVTFVVLAFHFPIAGEGIAARIQFLPVPRLLLHRSPPREVDSSCTPQLGNRKRNLKPRIPEAPGLFTFRLLCREPETRVLTHLVGNNRSC